MSFMAPTEASRAATVPSNSATWAAAQADNETDNDSINESDKEADSEADNCQTRRQTRRQTTVRAATGEAATKSMKEMLIYDNHIELLFFRLKVLEQRVAWVVTAVHLACLAISCSLFLLVRCCFQKLVALRCQFRYLRHSAHSQ